MMNRRQCLVGLTGLGALGGCEPSRTEQIYAKATPSQRRFKGTGAVLVVDAVPGSEIYGVEMFADDAIRPFYGKSSQRYRDTMAYPGGVLVPMKVRVTWRSSPRGVEIGWGAAGSIDFLRPVKRRHLILK
jgi:hypothetical protein